MSNDINKKEIKVKMGAVVFSDLLTMRETAARLVGIGQMNLSVQRNNKQKIQAEEIAVKEEPIAVNNTYTEEDLEREGNESLF